MTDRFENKVIVVTGAAGGIGSAAARRFAQDGGQVVISDVDPEACEFVTAALHSDGLRADALAADLKDKDACDVLIAQAVERHGRIDVLANNAGIIARGDILDITEDMWFDSFTINLHAMFHLCRAAIPTMRDAGGGAIVNTASTWGKYPGPGHIAYTTSKGAVCAFTQSLARDCAPWNIRVNAVCPNEIHTKMLESGFAQRGFDPTDAIPQLAETVPLGRLGQPEEVAATIAFLASDDASYICGALVEVTGGKPVC